MLQEELWQRHILRRRKAKETGARELEFRGEDLLRPGETLASLRDALVAQRLALNASQSQIRGEARLGASAHLSDGMLEALAKPLNLARLGPAANPINMLGLRMDKENARCSVYLLY